MKSRVIEPKFKRDDIVKTLITKLSNYDESDPSFVERKELSAGLIGKIVSSAIIGSRVLYCVRFTDGYLGSYDEYELIAPGDDDRCVNYSCLQRNVTVEEIERLEEELRCARSEVADLKNLIIKLLFDRYKF